MEDPKEYKAIVWVGAMVRALGNGVTLIAKDPNDARAQIELRVGSAYAPVSPALLCSEVGRLKAQLSSAFGAPFLPW